MFGARRPPSARFILAGLALLAAFAQPVGAVMHGVAHQQEASRFVGVAMQVGTSSSIGATESLGGLVEPADHDAADHPVLHERTVATLALSLAPATPVRWDDMPELAAVIRATLASGEARSSPLAFHELVPDQPRAPPLG